MLNFILWGYRKDKVYINKLKSIDELKEEIQYNIVEISQQLCQHVLKNFNKKVNVRWYRTGNYFSNVLLYIEPHCIY